MLSSFVVDCFTPYLDALGGFWLLLLLLRIHTHTHTTPQLSSLNPLRGGILCPLCRLFFFFFYFYCFLFLFVCRVVSNLKMLDGNGVESSRGGVYSRRRVVRKNGAHHFITPSNRISRLFSCLSSYSRSLSLSLSLSLYTASQCVSVCVFHFTPSSSLVSSRLVSSFLSCRSLPLPI